MKNLIFNSSFHEKLKMLLIAVGLLVTSLTTQMWGWNSWSSKTIYFDNSYWASDGYTPQLLIGRYYTYGSDSRGSSAETMTNISGTDLWYLSSYSYNNYTNEYFISNSSTWPNEYGCNYDGCSNCPESRVTYAAHYTNSYNTNGNNTYNLFVPTSASNNASLTYTSNSSYSTLLNSTQRIYQCVSENGGTPAKSTASIGTISISTKYLSSATAASNASGSISSGSNTVYKSAARTATVTMTATSIADGYTFLGWYDAESGGNRLESNTTYTYQASAAKTVYARFSHETTHTVNITYVCASPSATVATATSQAIGQVTASSITAPTVEGYTFSSWTLGSGMSNQSASTSVNPISVKTLGSGNYTMQANYTEDITSHWHLVGNSSDFPDGWNVNNTTMMQKKTGHSTDKIVYFTVNVTSTDTKEFKVVDDNGSGSDIYYGYSTGGTYLTWTATSTKSVYTGSGNANNLKYTPTVAGPYEFKVDYSGTYPAVTITYPTAYTLTYSIGSVAGNNGSISTSPTTASGSKVLSGNTVTLTGPAAKTGYAWKGWYTNAAGTEGKVADTNRAITVTMNADKTLYACYTENDYTVTVSAGTGGSVASGSVTGHYSTKVTLPTATANPGYYFTGWEVTSGTATLTSSSSATAAKINGMTDAVTVTANFASQWGLYSSINSWGDPTPLGNYSTSASKDYGYIEVTLAANTQYSFKIRDFQNGTNYKPSSNTEITYSNKATARTMSSTASGEPNQTIMTAGAGTYRFTWNITDKSIKMTYPTSYTVTFGKVASNGASIGSVSATGDDGASLVSGKYVAKGSATFTATDNITGYHFKEWRTSNTYGSGTFLSTDNPYTMSSISAKKTVYANYAANDYTVTLDVDEEHKGTISGATTSQTVYYKTATVNVPNLPTAENGYGLDGYYTDHNGGGTKVINGDGTWIASVSGYTDSNKKWIRTSGVTLYAYYKKAEITGLTVTPGTVGTGGTVTATPTIDPEPTGAHVVCWRLLQSNDNPVGSQPTFNPTGTGDQVTFTAPTVSGSYKVECVLRTGSECSGNNVLSTRTESFVVAGQHTVTILYQDADGRTLSPSVNVTGLPLVWSSAINPAALTGYTFDHWEAGDGITISTNGTSAISGTTTTTAQIYIKANYDGNLTAVYNKKNMIFFNNTLGWTDVWVYFYTSDKYWANNYGTGAYAGKYFDGQKPYQDKMHGHMTRIEGTDIWYFDYTAAGYSTYANVAFANMDKSNAGTDDTSDNAKGFFSNTTAQPIQVVRRGDHKSSLPMFVPLAGQTKTKLNENRAEYSNQGYWMNYPENTGYTLMIYNAKTKNVSDLLQEIPFKFTANKTMPMELTVELEANRTYGFEIKRADGNYYANDMTMKIGNSGDEGQTLRSFTTGTTSRCELKTSVAGDYIFKLNFGYNSNAYNYLVGVHFPIAQGDYRIVYSDNAQWSQSWSHNSAGHTWYHASRAIHKENGSKDIVSFYVRTGASASMKFQYASAISAEGVVTWADVSGGTIDLSGISASGVYNFHLTQANGAISVEKTEVYTGNYYIRTDYAGVTGWDDYRASDHQMTYSEFSKERSTNTFGELYTHYYMHWCERGKNIKFVVANDYSSCVSDTLESDLVDLGNMVSAGWLNSDGASDPVADKFSANIRFMYDERTNKISRAYLASSTNPSRKFLILKGNATFWNGDGSALSGEGESAANKEAIFTDNEDWIYDREIKVTPGTLFKLYACYAQTTVQEDGSQHFRGTYANNTFTKNVSAVELIGGTGSACKARIVYDFKTNRLMAAYVPDGEEISGTKDIEADIMILREHQGAGQQITFADNNAKLTDVKTVYGIMKFNRWTLNNRANPEDHVKTHSDTDDHIATYHPILGAGSQKSSAERGLYWISFPFDVNLSEVFGFGTYGTHWIILKYNGEERAKQGFWKDSEGFWEYVWDRKGVTLEAGMGYVLALDLDLMKASDRSFWKNEIQQVELFFPSTAVAGTIQRTNVDVTVPAWQCNIDRRTDKTVADWNKDRRIADSHWNIIGVPSYANYSGTLSDGTSTISWHSNPKTQDVPFLYEWNPNDNSYTVQSGTTYAFKVMHAYYVQYHGTLRWTLASATPPSSVAARRNKDVRSDYEFRLEVLKGDVVEDQAFVKLSDREEITDKFEFGHDLPKEFNADKANLYTMIEGYIPAAANSMQLNEETTIVPVGVQIASEGEYLFSMPDGTDGIGITLIDNQTGVRTNLALTDYAITLPAGDHNERFVLEISPIEQTTTSVETVNGANGDAALNGVCKKLIDGVLYIVKDGKVFDARGARIQ